MSRVDERRDQLVFRLCRLTISLCLPYYRECPRSGEMSSIFLLILSQLLIVLNQAKHAKSDVADLVVEHQQRQE